MKTLYIDIGNTNIAYFFNENSNSFSTTLILENSFRHEFLQMFPNIKKVVCASVVPTAERVFDSICNKYGLEFLNIKIEDIGIKVNIQNPQELGIDRAINAIAALQKFGKNVIVIDFGTALTFDIVVNNTYEGGMIFPGIAMAMHNLHTKTAKLPDVKVEEYQVGIGKNTVSAIKNSACIGYEGVIKNHIKFIVNYYKTHFFVVFTGGSGKIFQHVIDGSFFEENLILEYLKKNY